MQSLADLNSDHYFGSAGDVAWKSGRNAPPVAAFDSALWPRLINPLMIFLVLGAFSSKSKGMCCVANFQRFSLQRDKSRKGDKPMNVITRQAYHFEDLEVGMEATFAKSVSATDIQGFAEITGDRNPVHLDPQYAAKTIFKGTIAHGMLTASYISAVFGTELPGPGAIYISQTLNFRGPVRAGDRVVAKVRVMELYPAKHRARFICTCSVDGKVVLEGEAVLMVPSRAPGKAA
jgi:3-hydroxybutyryl-CoA dehydratase